MRTNLVDNIMTFGVALLITGVLIIVFSPSNLTVFTLQMADSSGPVGAVLSLVGLSLAIACGYRRI